MKQLGFFVFSFWQFVTSVGVDGGWVLSLEEEERRYQESFVISERSFSVSPFLNRRATHPGPFLLAVRPSYQYMFQAAEPA